VVEPDRRQAIHAALRAAAAGDVVVLAGKGDEPYQILDAGQVVPFDDRDVARQALSD
jgi:UDP-N-acetylmuramoyl-L-alanyl-D-glutamate--2,6-diaminopimelate ligase